MSITKKYRDTTAVESKNEIANNRIPNFKS